MTALAIQFTVQPGTPLVLPLDRWEFQQFTAIVNDGLGTLLIEATNQKPNSSEVYPAIPMSGVLTESGTPSDGDTVQIGSTNYTFRTAIGAPANEVLIGASGVTALNALRAAINTDSGSGTLYSAATVQNVEASAYHDNVSPNLTAISRSAGIDNPNVAVAEASAVLAWTDVPGGTVITELEGGADAGTFATRAVWTPVFGLVSDGTSVDTTALVNFAETGVQAWLNPQAGPGKGFAHFNGPYEALRLSAGNGVVSGIIAQVGAL